MDNNNGFQLHKLKNERLKMEKKGGTIKIIFYVAVIGWTIFTATKVFDMIKVSSPPKAVYLPWLSLLVISGGYLLWLGVGENLAKNTWQRGISYGMAILAWLLELTLAVADSVFRQTMFTLELSDGFKWLVTASPVVAVMLYLLASALFWWHDPDTQVKLQLIQTESDVLQARNDALKALAEASKDEVADIMAAQEWASMRAKFTADTVPGYDGSQDPKDQAS